MNLNKCSESLSVGHELYVMGRLALSSPTRATAHSEHHAALKAVAIAPRMAWGIAGSAARPNSIWANPDLRDARQPAPEPDQSDWSYAMGQKRCYWLFLDAKGRIVFSPILYST